MVRKTSLSLLVALAAFVVSSCSIGNKDFSSDPRAKKMEAYLENKYSEDFTLENVELLKYYRIGALTGGDKAGLKAIAYPDKDSAKSFAVEFWEKENVIEDGYINYIMADKLSVIVKDRVGSIWKQQTKLDMEYFLGPFGSLPDSKYDSFTEVRDYPYTAGIDVFIQYSGALDKKAAALMIDQLHKELISAGVGGFFTAIFFLKDEAWHNLDNTLADIKQKDESDYNMYSVCRATEDCWVSGGQGKETVQELVEQFMVGRE
ncbi:hypothetical protein [Paenibacillus ihuae]|uniref:hypothetical protein n=1 Tax=Paenibacillus ihuae TaxID=1232431 RepID=UPI0006D57CAE|nr:hypothetical protein [Paenibacillus ihuae]